VDRGRPLKLFAKRLPSIGPKQRYGLAKRIIIDLQYSPGRGRILKDPERISLILLLFQLSVVASEREEHL
jgi:hypothetical protein